VPVVLQLYTAARLEPLAARLAQVCADTPADPMAPEWIAVPSQGMRRWLMLELARHLGASGPGAGDGIAANFESAFPGSLRLRVLEADRDRDAPDPWRVERLAWAVLDVVDHAASDERLAPVVELPPGGSRYGRVRRVAELFDRYHVARPDMVRAWASGADVDAAGRPLAPHQLWQPHLWRQVRSHLGVAGPPERLPWLTEQLRSGALRAPRVELPERLLVFGLSMLPGGPGFLDLASAVGAHHDVHLFLLEPSPAASAHIAAQVAPLAGAARLRSEDRTGDLVAHPLLRSWGRLHRETTVLVHDARRLGVPEPERVVEPTRRRRGPVSLLNRLQADLRDDTEPTGELRPDADDRSVQFHACHGPTRQVEVLRDALLHLLADPELDLTEDDVLVVCPALERFAPTIEAVFGPSADAPGAHLDAARSRVLGDAAAPALRYRIADRSVRSANPVLTAAAALLDLVAGRFDAPGVLDFLSLAPVRARYRFSDDDLARLGDWVAETNVRWGLDAAHREGFGVPPNIVANTWRAATDRLLVGAAVHDDDLHLAVGGVVPFGIESDDVLVAGRLAELMWRLGDLAEQTGVPRPVGAWIELLRAAAHELFATTRDDEWQFEALLKVLGEIDTLSTGDAGPSTTPLEFIDVRRLLAERLDGAPGRPDFFRGGITISSMTPLRWVPHRVVALLGMDQAAFGSGAVDGDDLSASTPQLGDRDARAEARQALLETVLAAGDRLVLVRDGHDVRTNHEIPPAVVVAELRDTLVAMVHPEDRSAFVDRLEVHHPRQPFDERSFVPDALLGTGPWGFDGAALAGAVARRDRTTQLRPFLTERLPRDDSDVIELDALRGFLKHPVKDFLQRRLGVRLPRSEDRTSSLLPVALAPLERWKVGDRLLSARLAGESVHDWARTERRRGTLPPEALGERTITELADIVEQLVGMARSRGLRDGPPVGLPIDVQLADGTRVVGAVAGQLDDLTPGPARVSYSSAKPEHVLFAWLDLMALVATDPTVDWRALGVNRVTSSKDLAVIDLAVLADPADAAARRAAALTALEVAVDCYRRGSQEPIPLFPKVSQKIHLDEVRPSDWFHNMGFGDGDDVAIGLVFGGIDLESLLSIPALEDDPGDTLGRAAAYASHLWGAVAATTIERPGPGDPDDPDAAPAADSVTVDASGGAR